MRPFLNREIVSQPVKRDYDYASFVKGICGAVNYTIANRLFMLINGGTVWVGDVTGTSLYVKEGGGYGSNPLYASIDDGPFFPMVWDYDRFTVFQNLPQRTYRVLIAMSVSGYYPLVKTNINDVMTVWGHNPSIVNPVAFVTPGDGNTLCGYNANVVPLYDAGFVPAGMPATSSSIVGSGVLSMKIRCAAKNIIVISPSDQCLVSIDGGLYKQYTSQKIKGSTRAFRFNMDGNMHTYHIWQDQLMGQVNGTFNPFMIGSDAPFVDCGDKRKIDQYGSSSTSGFGSIPAKVDVMITAASLGLVGATYGIFGENLAGFAARVDALLLQKVVSAGDICVLQLGANNTGTFNSTDISNYNYAINAMLVKGYAKILCRGLPTFDGIVRSLENASINSIVSNYNNPKVIFINTDTWTGIEVLGDHLHPTQYGYITMAGYATAAYAPLI